MKLKNGGIFRQYLKALTRGRCFANKKDFSTVAQENVACARQNIFQNLVKDSRRKKGQNRVLTFWGSRIWREREWRESATQQHFKGCAAGIASYFSNFSNFSTSNSFHFLGATNAGTLSWKTFQHTECKRKENEWKSELRREAGM